MKQQADRKRKDCTFKEGDWVLLRLRPYRQLTVARRSSQKLAARFYGPYKILEQIGAVAFRLELPRDSRVHPVFHASLLRPYHAPTNFTVHHLPSNHDTLPPQHVPVAVASQRTILRQGRPVPQVLVQWSDLPPDDATWEDANTLGMTLNGETEGTLEPTEHLGTEASTQDEGDIVQERGIKETKRGISKRGREQENNEKGTKTFDHPTIHINPQPTVSITPLPTINPQPPALITPPTQSSPSANQNASPRFPTNNITPPHILIPPPHSLPSANQIPPPYLPTNHTPPLNSPIPSHPIQPTATYPIIRLGPTRKAHRSLTIEPNLEDKVNPVGPANVASNRPKRSIKGPTYLGDYILS